MGNPTYTYWRPVAAARRGFKMVLFTGSRRNTFVGGTCALPSALLVYFVAVDVYCHMLLFISCAVRLSSIWSFWCMVSWLRWYPARYTYLFLFLFAYVSVCNSTRKRLQLLFWSFQNRSTMVSRIQLSKLPGGSTLQYGAGRGLLWLAVAHLFSLNSVNPWMRTGN